MNDYDENADNPLEEDGLPANDILPDRDVLMMEKPEPDNRAARYKPADKKLLRNIIIIVFLLIAALVVLMVIVNNYNQGEGIRQIENPGGVEITPGSE